GDRRAGSILRSRVPRADGPAVSVRARGNRNLVGHQAEAAAWIDVGSAAVAARAALARNLSAAMRHDRLRRPPVRLPLGLAAHRVRKRVTIGIDAGRLGDDGMVRTLRTIAFGLAEAMRM